MADRRADRGDRDLQRVGDLLPQVIGKPLTPLEERLTAPMAEPEEVKNIVYQHSMLCQTCLPYRDPGDDIRIWQRRNGNLRMEIQAGRALDPRTGDFVDVGLPWGAKARLVLFHLNAEAVKQNSRYIDVEDSLTAFIHRTLKLDTKGRNIRAVKDQLSRLSASDFRLGTTDGHGRAVTVKSTIIDGFELWSPSDPNQKVLWPTVIQFSPSYFENLVKHAVPLVEEAIGRLSHNAMALDIYTWLAQRLHRVNPKKPDFVPWVSLKEQFGQGYDRMDNFKRDFKISTGRVKAVYREARFDFNDKGMKLRHCRPPVLKRYGLARVK